MVAERAAVVCQLPDHASGSAPITNIPSVTKRSSRMRVLMIHACKSTASRRGCWQDWARLTSLLEYIELRLVATVLSALTPACHG